MQSAIWPEYLRNKHGARHPVMQHPRHTRIVYYLYFLNIIKSVYIHLLSVYDFKIK